MEFLRKTSGAAVLVAPLLLSALLTAPLRGQDIRLLQKQARESVFLLRVFDSSGELLGTGTGFLVDGGMLVTNHHVIDSAARVDVMLGEKRAIPAAGIIAKDRDNDLALLRVPAIKRRPLPLETSRTLEPGDRVVVLGSPLGLSGTVSDGIVAALRPNGLGEEGFFKQPLLQITAPVSPGSSGSPVLNAKGAVVGVVVSQFSAGQNLNFAIPADSLLKLIARSQSSSLERRLDGSEVFRWSYLRNLGISAAFFVAIFLAFRKMRD